MPFAIRPSASLGTHLTTGRSCSPTCATSFTLYLVVNNSRMPPTAVASPSARLKGKQKEHKATQKYRDQKLFIACSCFFCSSESACAMFDVFQTFLWSTPKSVKVPQNMCSHFFDDDDLHCLPTLLAILHQHTMRNILVFMTTTCRRRP